VSTAPLTSRRRLRDRLPIDLEGFLTPDVRRFFLGTLLGALGTGIVLSLFVIYAVDVRHFSKWGTGVVMAWEAVLGITIAPYYGTLVDRFGPSKVLAVSMPASALGLAAIGWASTLPMLAAVATFFAVINAGGWSAFSTLMTRIVRDEHRQNAFGFNFLLLNAGIGVGLIIGTQIASTSDLHSFQLVYAMAGALQLASAVAWFTLRRHGGPPEIPEHGRASDGWREVLQDRRLVRLTVTGLLVMVCGYGSVEAGLPYFVTNVAHLSIHDLGIVFVVNTLTIVIGQVFTLAFVRGRSRSLALGAVGLLWGVSWLFATASVYVGTVAALVALCMGQLVFATGETIWQAVQPALVNELAPEHLRGRYNSLQGMVWGGGSAVGQLMALLFAQFGAGVAWTVVVAAGAIAGGIGITSLRRVLTATEDGRAAAPTPEPVSS